MSDKVKVLEGRILPVRFDNTELPGLLGSIVYLKTDDYTSEKLAELIAKKVLDEMEA